MLLYVFVSLGEIHKILCVLGLAYSSNPILKS